MTDPEPEDLKATISDLFDELEQVVALLEELDADVQKMKSQPSPGKEDMAPLSERFEPGEEYNAIIEDPDGETSSHGDPRARVDGVVTFLNGKTGELMAGDRVDVVVTDVGPSHLHAVVKTDQ